MPYNSNRVERISEEVTKELAMMLRDVKDPRVSQTMLSVVRCEVTNDMRWCKVFLSALGDYDQKELKNLRYTIDDVLEAMRDSDIFDITHVRYAIVETTGKINFFRKDEGKRRIKAQKQRSTGGSRKGASLGAGIIDTHQRGIVIVAQTEGVALRYA